MSDSCLATAQQSLNDVREKEVASQQIRQQVARQVCVRRSLVVAMQQNRF